MAGEAVGATEHPRSDAEGVVGAVECGTRRSVWPGVTHKTPKDLWRKGVLGGGGAGGCHGPGLRGGVGGGGGYPLRTAAGLLPI